MLAGNGASGRIVPSTSRADKQPWTDIGIDDYATIRRALIDYRLMNRHQRVYWLGEGRIHGDDAESMAGPAG